jgi:hypothetical protein
MVVISLSFAILHFSVHVFREVATPATASLTKVHHFERSGTAPKMGAGELFSKDGATEAFDE